MSGVYNQTYFNNHPHECDREGVLYGVILVNQLTFERECIKVGSFLRRFLTVSEQLSDLANS